MARASGASLAIASPSRPGLARSASGLLAALVASGCRHGAKDGSPAPVSSASAFVTDSRLHEKGELGRARDYAMSVDGVRDCPTGGPYAPRRGFTRVGVEIDLQGTSNLEVPANPFYATVSDPSGERYPATLTGCEPALSATVVAHDAKAHGFITFEVPTLTRKLELRYSPPVVGRDAEELRFAINR